MKKYKYKFNYTYIIVATIVGIAILGASLLNFVSKERDRQIEKEKILKSVNNESLQKTTNQGKLETCLQRAEDMFGHTFQLNSYPNPQPSYPSARRWNSFEIEESTQKTLENDKELCAKLYGDN